MHARRVRIKSEPCIFSPNCDFSLGLGRLHAKGHAPDRMRDTPGVSKESLSVVVMPAGVASTLGKKRVAHRAMKKAPCAATKGGREWKEGPTRSKEPEA